VLGNRPFQQEEHMNDIAWHQQQLQMYNRSLHTCKPHRHTAIMNMVVYHERMIHELNDKHNNNNNNNNGSK
jgi:hypothetical protein